MGECILLDVEAHQSSLIISLIAEAKLFVDENGTRISFNQNAIIDLFTNRAGRSQEKSAKLQSCVVSLHIICFLWYSVRTLRKTRLRHVEKC